MAAVAPAAKTDEGAKAAGLLLSALRVPRSRGVGDGARVGRAYAPVASGGPDGGGVDAVRKRRWSTMGPIVEVAIDITTIAGHTGSLRSPAE